MNVDFKISATVDYVCDNTLMCGRTEAAVVIDIDRSNVAGGLAQLEEHAREASRTLAATGYFGGQSEPPTDWLMRNLPTGWRATVIKTRSSGLLTLTYVTCSQRCLDTLLGRVMHDAARPISAEAKTNSLDHEWHVAQDVVNTIVHKFLHLFPHSSSPGTGTPLCGSRLTRTNQLIGYAGRDVCPGCVQARKELTERTYDQ
jgi:hypothetical protein